MNSSMTDNVSNEISLLKFIEAVFTEMERVCHP